MQPPPTLSSTTTAANVTHARLQWTDEQPTSMAFDDVYFSRESGLEESRFVFLGHNHLIERWQNLPPGGRFVIGETGFGSGLNFLAAAQRWLETAPADAQLHYLSVELYPLCREDLRRALSLWPELDALAGALIDAYPCHFEPETYSLSFAEGRIHLTLMIGDAAEKLRQQIYTGHPDCLAAATQVDAWFLDGFAPSKNPGMWTDALFAALAGLSHPGTSFATFTCAGSVKRGLQQAGFDTEKVPGFGRKREMLRGQFQAPQASTLERLTQTPYTPWFQFHSKNTRGRAAVIGAGLAGAHTARALADNGWEVDVFERHGQAGCEGSGNRQGVLYAKLSPQRHPQGRFNIAAYQQAVNRYRELWRMGLGQQCGVIQLEPDEQRVAAFIQHLDPAFARAIDAEQASHYAGAGLSSGGIWLAEAGWLNPPAVCGWLLDHPAIRCHYGRPVERLIPAAANHWHLHPDNTTPGFALVVVCCGVSANQFEQTAPLPLKSIRGQVSHLEVPAPLRALKCVVSGEGYVAPPLDDTLCTGATFTLKNSDPALQDADHQHNLAQLQSLLESPVATSLVGGRVGFRCTTPDYLPIAGPVPHWQQLTERFSPLTRNAKAVVASEGVWQPGLMINTGLGSRGLAYAPLTARLIAAQASGLPLPLQQDLIKALSPARFAIRNLARGK